MNSQQELPRIAVVGCGAAAREFCLPVLAKYPSYRNRIVLVDRSAEQAEATAREFGVEHWCTDHESLPIEVDAAMVTTPHQYHAEQSCYFLSEGRHVFVEKPLGMTGRETTVMLESANQGSAVLMVNNYRRLFPSYRWVRESIRSGELGRVRRITVRDGTRFAWASVSGFYLRDVKARGVLLDRGAHTIDVICWWLGIRPAVVRVHTDSQGGNEAVAHVELEANDVAIELSFSRLQRLENRYEIECESGIVRGRLFDLGGLQVVRGGEVRAIRAGRPRSYADWAWDLVRNFVEVVQGRSEPLFAASDVAPSIGVIEEAYEREQPFSLPWYERDPNIAALRGG